MAQASPSRPLLLIASGLALFGLGATCTAVFALLLFGGSVAQRAGGPARPAPEPVVVTPRGDLSDVERSTVDLFREASPSVVYITKLAVRTDIFRRNFQEIPEGTGSGFIWDDQGHVVTNFHVIQGADAARVTLSDQTAWPADLVGYVAEKDVAVLKIEAPTETLRALPVGTSSDLSVGQHVFAIGNPFGFDHTLSTGVISGLDREINSVTRRPISGVIQTDAAINPGNSGGPLLDSAGRLIGMNTAIYSPSGAYAGIGFAVPVDTVRRMVTQLIEHGRVVRPGLGIQMATPELARRLRIRGVLIMGVDPNTAAAQAGLQPTRRDAMGRLVLGDIIVGVDDDAVDGPEDLYRILDRHAVGDEVRVKVMRRNERLELSVRLSALLAR